MLGSDDAVAAGAILRPAARSCQDGVALPCRAGPSYTPADRMRRYLTHRLLSALLVLVGVSFVVFLELHLAPGDPAQILLGPMATPSELTNLRTQLGLDRAMIVQYGRWAGRAVQGDLGRSIMLRRPVLPELARRFQATLILAGGAGSCSGCWPLRAPDRRSTDSPGSWRWWGSACPRSRSGSC